ncbi:hypothetical protein BN77_p10880 [Rhizobium mesoamericanum STM3625]|uniref:Uncharacterized protein n=1 Tax=Rhizobium mesoamericanum STM3625 TaxID=1211777 RepID=K0PWU0_9HYPH|nr:hypothetical protein BN77_p10880 [Rhizobium mesoamericanum STM3625]
MVLGKAPNQFLALRNIPVDPSPGSQGDTVRQLLGQIGFPGYLVPPDRGQAPWGAAMLSRVSVALSDLAGVFLPASQRRVDPKIVGAA